MLFKSKVLNKAFFILSAILIFTAAAYCGDAYNFELKDMKGDIVRLSDFKGKVIFLDFWASWCPPCRHSMPAVKDLHKKYLSNPDVVILGINAGEKQATVEKFIKKEGIEYTVLLGDNSVMQKYGVSGIPAFFIIDRNGNIAKRFVGYYGGVEKEWEKEIEFLLKQE
ncbi:MAG: TlpA family protein disulfide reductase [Endomicrobia bacterium]|nr:TlpA family protein disulfide reductase [Endomicrobiia bacterium]MCL2507165.1 TlpA family protein disulfide reductase [Endomicrobiia bacterium]